MSQRSSNGLQCNCLDYVRRSAEFRTTKNSVFWFYSVPDERSSPPKLMKIPFHEWYQVFCSRTITGRWLTPWDLCDQANLPTFCGPSRLLNFWDSLRTKRWKVSADVCRSLWKPHVIDRTREVKKKISENYNDLKTALTLCLWLYVLASLLEMFTSN